MTIQGNMMDRPLLVSSLIEYAEQSHPEREIVSVLAEGGEVRTNWRETGANARRAANLLRRHGVKQGERVATLAWNTKRHLEVYFGISGMGAVLHTVNPRLFPEQIVYIMNHAEDRHLFTDVTFLPLVEAVLDKLETVEKVFVFGPADQVPQGDRWVHYETALQEESPDYEWPLLPETAAASLCYTSGTTGNPKGVLYHHRSTLLHCWGFLTPACLPIVGEDVLLPVVPMFHVNAWGVPYAAAMVGAKLVLPGPGLDGASLHRLIKQEDASIILGVPTVWLGLLQHMDQAGEKLDSVKTAIVGGSAAPLSMIQAFDEKHDVFLLHAWGMTEMSPLGTATPCTQAMREMPAQERYKIQQKQGKAIFGCDMRIADDEGNDLPHDGETFGRLMVRGPWIIQRYYKATEDAVDEQGWFDTGDVATITPDGYMQIVDRSKDVIKSGGEWISSIDLENAAVGHPGVAEACVIGVPHPKWDERPLLLLIKNGQAEVTRENMLEFLADKVAKWWLPDDVIFVEELPHTATGKLQKFGLRDQYREHLTSQAS